MACWKAFKPAVENPTDSGAARGSSAPSPAPPSSTAIVITTAPLLRRMCPSSSAEDNAPAGVVKGFSSVTNSGLARRAGSVYTRAGSCPSTRSAPLSMIGKSLRQYVITGRLGQGGMGEVWLARDTTLERSVALKVLPAGDTDAAIRKERFFREARAASALNHPNIITIYEINSDQGIDFIAMEYVDGRTLGVILHQGQLPIDLVQRYASQIAEAVGRAHREGIVHRDLKPGNIMVTNEGLVKVLDFGLAKVLRAVDAS